MNTITIDMITCKLCKMEFTEEKRLKIHSKTHQKDIYKKQPKRNKNPTTIWFPPDFQQGV